jgi:hypothetical protein
MKNILCLGFRPDHHQTLTRIMSKRFRLITFKGDSLQQMNLPNIVNIEDVIDMQNLSLDVHDVHKSVTQFYGSMGNKLGQSLPDFPMQYLFDEHNQVMDAAQQQLGAQMIFEALCNTIQLDFVIANAEYDASRRPFVLMAQDRGIPTLNIQHGYLVQVPKPHAYKHYIPLNYVCDFVNVDNELEKSYFEEHKARNPSWKHIEIICCGTSLDHTVETGMAESVASQRLDIVKDKTTVGILPTWHDAYEPCSIQGMLFEIQFYKDIFAKLALEQKSTDLQVLVKAHPAFVTQNIFPKWQAAIRDLAAKAGLKNLSIYSDQLAEVMTLCDFFISNLESSVCWEAFVLQKPSLIWSYPSFRSMYDPKEIPTSNELYKTGGLVFARDKEEMTQTIERFISDSYRDELRQKLGAVQKKYHIQAESPEQKSLNLVQWLETKLSEKTETPQKGSAAA